MSEPSPVRATRSAWVTLWIVLVGGYCAVLNITVISVALPEIDADLGTTGGAIDVDWVSTAYLLGVVFALPATGWVADRFGRRTTYLACVAVFGVGSVLCMVAPVMPLLVGGRFVQGAGGGALLPIGMTIILEAFPPDKRGTAMGIWGVGIAGAPAAGPALGGWLVIALGWRSIFVVFLVLAALAFLLALMLPKSGYRQHRRFDALGWGLASAVAVLAVFAIRQSPSFGATSPILWALVVTVVACAVWLVVRSLKVVDPIIDFRMFGNWTFNLTLAVTAFINVAQYARLNFLALELQTVRDFDAQYVGLLLAPAAIGVAVTGPLGGWLTDRVGARTPVVGGLVAVVGSMWMLATLRVDTPSLQIAVILVLQGCGIGLANMPVSVASMNSLPQRYVAQGSAISNLTGQFAAAAGVAVFGAVLVAQVGSVTAEDVPADAAQDAFNNLFLIAFWIAVIGLVAAAFLPGARRSAAIRAVRAAEETAERPARS
ncbi:DHA2 family efflux MFS transporter permease subunit [Streptomyces sp. NBC_00444]|uniref:DHA2 family efflux MFS transporter permease subunit n=1 Tax=Streptomyces sp. NBC_00444 TaxID=2975744 RepID=UPI002E201F2A